MREITTTTKVYQFDELSEHAQQTALENERDSQNKYGYDWLDEDMRYQLNELLEANQIKNVDTQVRYSLGYSQGDGASFTGDIEYKGYRATIGINQWGYSYSHSKTVQVTEMTRLTDDKDASDKLIAELDTLVEKIGKELEKYGYDCIEANQSDENIKDILISNDYEFTGDGLIA